MSFNDWTKMPFDQAVKVNPSVPLRRGYVYPFVDMQAVDPNARSVTHSEIREFKGGGSRFISGDTLMARITPCLENGKIARYIAANDETLGHGSTEFIVIRGKEKVTDNGFAYYLTKWEGVHQFCISQMTGSSGRQRVPTTALSHCEVCVPPIKEQQAIACILGVLDDKIELNRRMNKTLEETARAIFKSWFVDFDPVRAKAAVRREHPDWTNTQVSRAALLNLKPEIAELFPDAFENSELGEIPKGWQTISLYDTASFINGAAFKSNDFCAAGDGLPIIKIAELKNGLSPQTKWSTREANPDQLINTGDLLYSWSGSPDTSLDAFLWTNGPGLLNQHIFKVVTENITQKRFVFYLLKYLRPILIETARNKQTTGLGHVTVADMRRLKVCRPPNKVMEMFGLMAGFLFDKAFACLLEISTIAELRDTLLSKLISGVLRIRNVEKIIERI